VSAELLGIDRAVLLQWSGAAQAARGVYPCLSVSGRGQSSPLIEFYSATLSRRHLLRSYVPPDYPENTLNKHLALFMQG